MQAFVYDAVSLLGFGNPSEEPLPEPKKGEVIIRYGGWSLRELRDKLASQQAGVQMWDQDWYHEYQWSNEKLPLGVYRLRVPVSDSDRKTFDQQTALLLPGEEAAPIVLVASALLAHMIRDGSDLIQNGWTRCREMSGDCYVGLGWDDGRLFILGDSGEECLDRLWLSSVRGVS